MKTERLLLISIFVIIAFIFFFHAAEASPIDRLSLPVSLPVSLPEGQSSSRPASLSQSSLLLAPDVDANISITMLDSPDPVSPGSTLSYTLTVTNQGPARSGDLVLTDTLPISTTFQTYSGGGWTCTLISGNRVVCTHNRLNFPGSANLFLTVLVAQNAPALISNTAIVRADTTTDPTPGNNTATQSTTVTHLANLGLAISDAPDPVSANTNLTYNVTVSNAGPSEAVGVVFTDTLSAGVTFQSYTAAGWTCTLLGAQLRCVKDTSMPAGTNSQVAILTHVNAGTPPGTVTNTAIVRSSTLDPVLANNNANASTTVQVLADLMVTIADSPDPVTPGQNLVYSIDITNNGPADAVGVRITDTLPLGVSYVSHTPTPEWTCTTVASELRCSRAGNLVIGGSAQLAVTVSVSPGVTSQLSNLVRVGATTSDPQSANNTDTELTAILLQSNLSLTKSDSADPITAGSNLNYTLVVANAGPSAAANLVLTDSLPSSLTYLSYGGTAGWSCSLLAGNRLQCTRSSLAVGANSTVTVQTRVASNATGTLTNTAGVRSTGTDPSLVNNNTIQPTAVTASADLGITLTHAPDPVNPGASLTYTVTVNNLGPSDAVGVVFTDTLPSGVAYQSYTGAGWTCTLIGLQLRCARAANLVASTNSRVVILTQVNPGTPSGPMGNSVIVRSSTPDPVAANNTAANNTTVQVFADLVVGITDSADPVSPGTSMAYTIIITNTGPGTSFGVKITDTLPVGVSYITHVPSAEWSCTIVGSQVRCSKTTALSASQSVQLAIVVSVSSNVTSPLSNVVTIGATTFDPLKANNTATETTGILFQSDLSITKTDSADPVVAGTNLNYSLLVANTGPSIGVNLVLTDTLPANLTYLSFGGSAGWSCSLLSGNRLRCTRPSLSVGANSTVTVQTRVASSATGTLNNSVIVRSTGTDPSLANNSAATATVVNQSADLSVTKTDSPDPVAEGQTLTYRVVVKNNGPSDSANVVLNDALPSEVTFVSAVTVPSRPCSGTTTISCSLGNMVSGNSITVTLTTTAKLVASQPKTITNNAQVVLTTPDPVSTNNAQVITTQVLPVADLRINVESRLALVQSGKPLTYTLWITNTGTSIATNVVVTDTLPAELTFKSSTRTPSVTSPKVVWNLGNLGVGQSVSFVLVVNVTSPTKTLVNAVSTRSSTLDILLANNQDQVSVQAVDSVPPYAAWMLPVQLGGEYYVGRSTVFLEVLASDNVAVNYVRFYRWDGPSQAFVDIGLDFSPAACQSIAGSQCFQWLLDTSVLNPKWNELRVRAYDASGNIYPSSNVFIYIFIYKMDAEIYLPFMKK